VLVNGPARGEQPGCYRHRAQTGGRNESSVTVALTPTIAVAMTGAMAKGCPSDVEYAQVLALTWGSPST